MKATNCLAISIIILCMIIVNLLQRVGVLEHNFDAAIAAIAQNAAYTN